MDYVFTVTFQSSCASRIISEQMHSVQSELLVLTTSLVERYLLALESRLKAVWASIQDNQRGGALSLHYQESEGW